MSVSFKVQNSIDVAKAMGHDKFLLPKDNPIAKQFNPPWVWVQCRKCQGAGVDKIKGDACIQCNGNGAEKLSPKAIRRAAKKMQVPE